MKSGMFLSALVLLVLMVSCGQPRQQANPLDHPNSANIITHVNVSPAITKDWTAQNLKFNLNCIVIASPKGTKDILVVGLRNPCPPNGLFTNVENTAFKLKLGMKYKNPIIKDKETIELILKDKFIVGYLTAEKNVEVRSRKYTLVNLCNYPTTEAAQCVVNIDKGTGHLIGINEKELTKALTTESKEADRKKALFQATDLGLF